MARRLILLGWCAALLGAVAFYGVFIKPMQDATMSRGNAIAEQRTRADVRMAAAVSALDRERAKLELARTRLDVEEALAARAPDDSVTLALRVVAEEWKTPERAAVLRTAVRGAWAGLGLSTTKVAVGIVVLDRPTMRQWGRALRLGPMDPVAFYIPPDSLAPATCVAVVGAPRNARESDPRKLLATAASWFGPCAYEAQFGIPGAQVRQWLANRMFDVAMNPDWLEGKSNEGMLFPWYSLHGNSREWFWMMQYMAAPHTAGCAAGRAEACVVALRVGDHEPRGPVSGVIARSDSRWQGDQALRGADYFLSAVLRAGGTTKFREFWRTSLPIDSALTIALGAPAGEWTAQWEAKVATPPRFGPMPGVLEPLAALLLAALAVGITARNVRRREVG